MSYEDLMKHPELLEDLLRKARCERAEAMYRLLVAPLKRLAPRMHAPIAERACSRKGFSAASASS